MNALTLHRLLARRAAHRRHPVHLPCFTDGRGAAALGTMPLAPVPSAT